MNAKDIETWSPPVWGWYSYRTVVSVQTLQGGKERQGEGWGRGGGGRGEDGGGGDAETASDHQHEQKQRGRDHLPLRCSGELWVGAKLLILGSPLHCLALYEHCSVSFFNHSSLIERHHICMGCLLQFWRLVISLSHEYNWMSQTTICETQPPASIGWVALSCCSFVRPSRIVTPHLIYTIWCFRPYKPYIFCEDMILATYPEFIAELSPVYWCLFGLPSSHSFYKDLKTPLPTQKDLFWSYDSHES